MDVDSSNLILGIGRKLSKAQEEPSMLPSKSPVPSIMPFRIEGPSRKDSRLTRGSDHSLSRFQSEWYPLPAPFCDPRPSMDLVGDPTRITGRLNASLRNSSEK